MILFVEDTYFQQTLLRLSHTLSFLKTSPAPATLSEADRKSYYRQFNRLWDPLRVENQVGVVEIVGPLMQGATPREKLLGATDYRDVIGDLATAANDPKIKAVVVDVDSGGGMALGAPELADAVASLAEIKPVVAHTSTLMASAAYYAIAGATAITATGSSIVGSIGTYRQLIDISAALEKMGIKVELIKPAQSDLKAAGHPAVPLTEAQRAYLTAGAEETNAEFIKFVQAHRPKVTMDSMRGQTFSGNQAVDAGLIDAIGSFDEAKKLAIALAA